MSFSMHQKQPPANTAVAGGAGLDGSQHVGGQQDGGETGDQDEAGGGSSGNSGVTYP
jgi:hypothetical protein